MDWVQPCLLGKEYLGVIMPLMGLRTEPSLELFPSLCTWGPCLPLQGPYYELL